MATTIATALPQGEAAYSAPQVLQHTSQLPSAEPDHPEGEAIRRQVEYYFSDENLPTDTHLLAKCGGRDNTPVSLKSIYGFKKMRGYKPRMLVTAALRKSTFLQVSADGKSISRKVPFQGKCVLDPDFFDMDDIAYDPSSSTSQAPPVRPVMRAPPPAKKELPPGMTKNMMKPTGFEVNHVEGPLTPQQAAEEEEMYHPDRQFVDRIELAISRFQRTRRKHQKYAQVFDSLMRFGGVEQTSHMFQGLSKHDMEDMDAEEISRATARHSVPWDRQEEDKWIVDFAGLIKVFLSSYFRKQFGLQPELVKNACQVPRSFYNYLRYHGVCPEYDHQLKEALEICDRADRELPLVGNVGQVLPGRFNKAASVCCGGSQASICISGQSWAADYGPSKQEASIVFKTGVTALGTQEQFELLTSQEMDVVFDEETGLEIIDMISPTEDERTFYTETNKTMGQKLDQLEPLGKLICKPWISEDCEEYDLPKDRYPTGKPKVSSKQQTYEFWVDESSLEGCFIGMKLEARVLILKGGMTILDEVRIAHCSFYSHIPNEMWVEHKPMPVVWRKRTLVGEVETDAVDNIGGDGEAAAATGDCEDDFDDEW